MAPTMRELGIDRLLSDELVILAHGIRDSIESEAHLLPLPPAFLEQLTRRLEDVE